MADEICSVAFTTNANGRADAGRATHLMQGCVSPYNLLKVLESTAVRQVIVNSTEVASLVENLLTTKPPESLKRLRDECNAQVMSRINYSDLKIFRDDPTLRDKSMNFVMALQLKESLRANAWADPTTSLMMAFTDYNVASRLGDRGANSRMVWFIVEGSSVSKPATAAPPAGGAEEDAWVGPLEGEIQSSPAKGIGGAAAAAISPPPLPDLDAGGSGISGPWNASEAAEAVASVSVASLTKLLVAALQLLADKGALVCCWADISVAAVAAAEGQRWIGEFQQHTDRINVRVGSSKFCVRRFGPSSHPGPCVSPLRRTS